MWNILDNQKIFPLKEYRNIQLLLAQHTVWLGQWKWTGLFEVQKWIVTMLSSCSTAHYVDKVFKHHTRKNNEFPSTSTLAVSDPIVVTTEQHTHERCTLIDFFLILEVSFRHYLWCRWPRGGVHHRSSEYAVACEGHHTTAEGGGARKDEWEDAFLVLVRHENLCQRQRHSDHLGRKQQDNGGSSCCKAMCHMHSNATIMDDNDDDNSRAEGGKMTKKRV